MLLRQATEVYHSIGKRDPREFGAHQPASLLAKAKKRLIMLPRLPGDWLRHTQHPVPWTVRSAKSPIARARACGRLTQQRAASNSRQLPLASIQSLLPVTNRAPAVYCSSLRVSMGGAAPRPQQQQQQELEE